MLRCQGSFQLKCLVFSRKHQFFLVNGILLSACSCSSRKHVTKKLLDKLHFCEFLLKVYAYKSQLELFDISYLSG